MMIVGTMVFFTILIFAAYKIGDHNALYGVVFFMVGTLGFVGVTQGPEALFGGGCSSTGYMAPDC